jgi:hypothetical protein
MDRTAKMDLHGVRTAADVERKYNFGKSFAEVMGIATDAQNLAQQAVEKGANLTQEEVFNALTNNGQAQGIFRTDNGEVYINAEYIVSLASMFANDIVMTGTFTCQTEGYIVPDDEVHEAIVAHILNGGGIITDELIPLYDFNGDGEITSVDGRIATKMMLGLESMANWSGAKKTPITLTIDLSDPEKAIHYTTTNMWGREVSGYWGVNTTSARCPATEERIDALEARIAALENSLGGGDNGG